MEIDITVTASRLRDEYYFDWFWRGWMDTGFGIYSTSADGTGGGGAAVTIGQVATAPKNNYTIAATSTMPKIQLKDLTPAQFEAYMEAYDNVAKDAKLAAEFQKLATNGVTLTLTVAAELPAGASLDARATITFKPVVGDFQGNNESVMPGTEVLIVIKASRIRNDLTWEDTFEGILAHEFTHLKRDSNGRYLDDPATYDHDDETYDNLFGATSLAGYSNSLGVTASIDQFGSLTFTGTNGNNHIDMFGTGALGAYTGAGNDMIVGHSGADAIYVTGGGKKAIVEPGYGYDMIFLATIASASKVVLTYIGSDLYITSSDSAYSPVDDPNAVVVIGQTANSSLNAVETIMTADAYWTDLYAWWAASPTADQTLEFAAEDGLRTLEETISTADSPVAISGTSFGQGYYMGDTNPAALYEFMTQRASLSPPPESVWPG